MSRLRFALLHAAHGDENTSRNFRRELDADLAEFEVTEGELPADHEFDGVVVTGSRASVYWDEAWIPPLVDWVAEAHEREIPILGVCYGHQVLAEALGGRVAGMDGFEIGYNEIERRPEAADDALLDGLGDSFLAFTTHGDTVVDLPPEAELLAENEHGVHAFRAGNAWGVQFHPEYDIETAREVTEGKRDSLDDGRVDAVLDDITPANYETACEAKRLFENFTQYAERVAASFDANEASA
ncbi:GMP synthase [glutamine-hydrolyzing] subunit A [Halolamina pelagica]|uniref:GMP synthase [glutamine-hydrolyzing] subunit A n=1 Tax=Halolamina pelagica TaxID=699431 RepID=A0A0P7GM27_9EURY|nr:type 1 glutamine amidotransferase [Halolamina pelagica]KPN29606.1 GMP synthase [glutamine-hydrolyzing] subunit A [Halolamina pelagica]